MWLFLDRDAEIERLRGVAAELSEQLAGVRREIQIVAALKMALADERKQRAAAKAAASASQELIEARATIEDLLKRVRELEEKRVFEQLRKLATANPDKPSPLPDKEIARLKEVNKELRIELREMHGW